MSCHSSTAVTRSHDASLVRLLLRAGAGVGRRDGAGRTALHVAALANQSDAVAALLEAGADANVYDVAAPNARGNTQLAVVALLLDAGADPGVVDIHGYQPRTKARALGRDALVELLPPLEGEPPIDESASGIAAVVLAHETGVELLWRPNDVVKPFDFSESDARERYGHDGTATVIEAARPGVFAALAPWFLPLLERMTKGQMPTVTEVDAAHRRASGAEVVTRPFRS